MGSVAHGGGDGAHPRVGKVVFVFFGFLFFGGDVARLTEVMPKKEVTTAESPSKRQVVQLANTSVLERCARVSKAEFTLAGQHQDALPQQS